MSSDLLHQIRSTFITKPFFTRCRKTKFMQWVLIHLFGWCCAAQKVTNTRRLTYLNTFWSWIIIILVLKIWFFPGASPPTWPWYVLFHCCKDILCLCGRQTWFTWRVVMNTCDIFAAMKQDIPWWCGGWSSREKPFFKEQNNSNPTWEVVFTLLHKVGLC